ncbi:MAG: glycosyltransferase family 39 protein, partial [Caulobacterales bacterium]|nr:glycosyltransferase family 39 protein [Caulobacterales bacterium]
MHSATGDAARPSPSGRSGLGAIEAAASAVLGLVILAAAVGAFVGLKASSLYIDELVTTYIVQPVSGGPDSVWVRALEDVHPPVYPVLAAAATAAVGDVTIGARGLSALASLGILAVLFAATRGVMDRPARLFTVATAATSGVWFYNAQYARGYALAILFAAGLAFAGLSALRQIREGREVDARTLAAMAGLGVLGALTHYYVLLLTGAVIGYFVLTAPGWAQRARFAATGLAVLALVGGFLAFHSAFIVVDREALWFDTGLSFYAWHITTFAKTALGSGYGVLIAGLLSLAALALALQAARARDVSPVHHSGLGLCLFAVAGTIGFGVALSVLVTPNFSARNPSVALPFLWIAFGVLFQEGARRFGPHGGRAFIILCVALTALAGLRVTERLTPSRQEWRGSAAYVDGLAACEGAVIPVVEHDPAWISAPFGVNHYGFYLPGRPASEFLDVPAAI